MKRHLIAYMTVALLTASALGVEQQAEVQPQVLNVVLLEIQPPSAPALDKPVLNDWPYWEKNSRKLLARLEKDFGHARCKDMGGAANASLFGVRVQAKSLADAARMDALTTELDGICEKTKRPSFLVVWMPREDSVLLGLQDAVGLRARPALDMLGTVHFQADGPEMSCANESAYAVPPLCLSTPNANPFKDETSRLDGVLRGMRLELAVNSLIGAEYGVIVNNQILDLAEAMPAGAAFEVKSLGKSEVGGPQPGDFIVRHGKGILGPPITGGLADDIPHVGVVADPKRFGHSAIDLQKVGNRSVIAGTSYDDPARFKNAGYFSLLESNIPVKYGDRFCTFRQLPPEVKASIRSGIQESMARDIGSDVGQYHMGPGKSAHCFDYVLDRTQGVLNREGIQVQQYKGLSSFGWKREGDISIKPQDMHPTDLRRWFTVGEPLAAVMHGDMNRTLTDPSRVNDRLPFIKVANPTAQIKPGGILLAPELEIVADVKGLTGQLASEAVAAVKGNKAGGEFTFEGKKYIAAKAPKTAGLFRVKAGAFQMDQKDLSVEAEGEEVVALRRFYDSTATESSALGPGWSFAPYALRVGQTADVPGANVKAAKKPVFVDRETGAELAYELLPLPTHADAKEGAPCLPLYRKVTSSQQPDLLIASNGTYCVRFLHGFEIAFDADGQLMACGDATARTTYRYEGARLVAIESGRAAIEIAYGEQGKLSAAKTSDGKQVAYTMDGDGRLAGVNVPDGIRWKFGYGQDGRLATVERADAKKPEEWALAANNRYDAQGRMTYRRTPQGEWTFAYDDDIGQAVITGPDGKATSYFYDGFQRLVAYGSAKDDMTLFNYDVTGRILQVAKGQLLNDPSGGERPRFKVLNMVTPLPADKIMKPEKG